MRLRVSTVVLAVLVPLAYWAGQRGNGSPARAPGAGASTRDVLYYVDPMNPSFRSKVPGTAPCGMPLEPVYADGGGSADTADAIAVRASRQQLVGVTVEKASRRVVRHRLRLLGRVAVDEARLFRLYPVTPGWIRELGVATTGSFVRRGEVLASYYAPETATPQQTLLYTLDSRDKVRQTSFNRYDNLQGGDQLAAYERNLRLARQNLSDLGFPPEQIAQIEAARQPARLVQIRAPAAALVLARNVSLGQRFEPAVELFTLADIRRVWVLADANESDAPLLRPGAVAHVRQPRQGHALEARVSRVPPQFDTAARTLRVRLELDNPGFLLRPDMYVDVEVDVELGPALVIPGQAVIDSGARRIVYVRTGEGEFSPRPVQVGWRHEQLAEILSGLQEGEDVVTSGNFLLDSESRMRTADPLPAAAAAAAPDAAPKDGPGAETAVDPVCGMTVEAGVARAAGLTSQREGRTVHFCNPSCKRKFDADPARYARADP